MVQKTCCSKGFNMAGSFFYMDGDRNGTFLFSISP